MVQTHLNRSGRWTHWILARRRQHFSKVFYERHHAHFTGTLRRILKMLAFTGLPAAALLTGMFHGWGDARITSVAIIIFLLAVFLVLPCSIADCFLARVLPYFERSVGGTDTFMSGRCLLWHSRQLDAIATRHGVRPLSEFASGDDLMPGEELRCFPCAEALLTVDCLLAQTGAVDLPAKLTADLVRLRDALRLADAKGIRFCLLLREGSFTSGWDLSRRKGSFF